MKMLQATHETNNAQIIFGKNFCSMKHTLYLMEQIFVGETGIGKTSIIQYLANSIGTKLSVINLSCQSDLTDLIGGFKPFSAAAQLSILIENFEKLLSKLNILHSNKEFLNEIQNLWSNKQWKTLCDSLLAVCLQLKLLNSSESLFYLYIILYPFKPVLMSIEKTTECRWKNSV